MCVHYLDENMPETQTGQIERIKIQGKKFSERKLLVELEGLLEALIVELPVILLLLALLLLPLFTIWAHHHTARRTFCRARLP